jgi:1-hydroxycarotenoid 3,4-desaturase
LPEVPTVYVCAQDRGATVPTGPERLLVLANAPAVGDQNQPALSDLEALQERTFAHLQRLGLHITSAAPAVRTGPADWERLFPASGGALYGAANHTFSASLQRPGAETSVPGLFLAGGTAHPGAGLPMAALSGRLAAQAIVARHGRPRSLLGAA